MEAVLIKALEARGGNLLLKDIGILETKEQHHDWRKKALRWGKDQDLDQAMMRPGDASNTNQSTVSSQYLENMVRASSKPPFSGIQPWKSSKPTLR
jgi:hypothetical protein